MSILLRRTIVNRTKYLVKMVNKIVCMYTIGPINYGLPRKYYFAAAAICVVSSCFTTFALPSRISRAYSSFGTITSIRIDLLSVIILVPRCESVRIASILPTCAFFAFPTAFSMCVHPKSSFFFFLISTPKVRTPVYDRPFIFSPFATEIYRVRHIFVTHNRCARQYGSRHPPFSSVLCF